jgi:uncharacterized membrane protein HdeD (DUF308 family)
MDRGALSIIAGIIAFVWPGRTLLVLAVSLAWFLVFSCCLSLWGDVGRPRS